MNLNNGEFETIVDDGMFYITIIKESDWSTDGGYSFEDITNTYELDKKTARDLLNELKLYLGDV